jgi:hypothetical protein
MFDPFPNADRSGTVFNRPVRRRRPIPVPDQFVRDLLRMMAILFAPMLVGAALIPLLMLVFSLLGYPY